MLALLRRLVVALLVVTLASQLVEAQALVCDRMQTMSMPSHDGHAPAQQAGPGAQESHTGAPTTPDCGLAANCVNAPAVLLVASPTVLSAPVIVAIPDAAAVAPFRALQPDLPPPRI